MQYWKWERFIYTQIAVSRSLVEYRFSILNKRRIYLFYVYQTHDEMEKFNFVSKTEFHSEI